MGTKELDNLTLEEYTTLEKESGQRFEYHDGYVLAMAGGTYTHGMLCHKVASLLDRSLEGKECTAGNSELKIHLAHLNRYVYPDAFVFCGPPEIPDELVGAISNPVIIVEVFSESSEKYDRGQKFHKYRRLSSFQNYVLVAQDKMYVEVWYRPPGADLWRIDIYEGEGAQAHLQSVDIQISISELYSPVKEQLEIAAKKAAEEEKR